MPDPMPLSLARLAEIDTESRLALDAAKGARHFTLELIAEVRRLSASLHLAARITDEPCPLCLSLAGESEVCALHHEIDEATFLAGKQEKRISALEVEVGETNLVLEQQDRDLERMRARIRAIETGLREACDELDAWWEDQRRTGVPARDPRSVRLRALADGTKEPHGPA